MWKKYYVILLARTLVILFWDGHGFILNAQSWWTFPLFEAWGTWNEVEIYDTKTNQEGSTYVEGENRKRKNWTRRNINCRRNGNWEKIKELKKQIMGKVVENNVFNRWPPMFSCIRLQKGQQCCKPKIGGETQVTNKLSSESSKDQIQYMTMCERSIMWYCSH